jgi:choice-of-anchor B domain-containing protein
MFGDTRCFNAAGAAMVLLLAGCGSGGSDTSASLPEPDPSVGLSAGPAACDGRTAADFSCAVGTNTCNEGLHIIDITTPNNPLFAGCQCFFEVHDAQRVSDAGPDADYANAEICANSAEDRVKLVDVTNKSATVWIANFNYPQLAFVHQGWLTEDHGFLLIGDELDESSFGVPTRTHIFDVSDLDAPVYISAYGGPTASIDHNLYVLGNRVFEANYTSGLRVLEFGDLANSELNEVAHFDTFPASNATGFDGAWSVYPYLPSGNVLVSDISNGLFVLTVQ